MPKRRKTNTATRATAPDILSVTELNVQFLNSKDFLDESTRAAKRAELEKIPGTFVLLDDDFYIGDIEDPIRVIWHK
jgi:hypothetical protein